MSPNVNNLIKNQQKIFILKKAKNQKKKKKQNINIFSKKKLKKKRKTQENFKGIKKVNVEEKGCCKSV